MTARQVAAVAPVDRFYVQELDGLRFLAFLSVFLSHATVKPLAAPVGSVHWNSLEWWTSSATLAGGFGVDLFFVLSSFLITSLLVREREQRGRIDVTAFWMRRILRIWPLYYSFVLLCWVCDGLPGRIVAGFALFSGNWAILAWPFSSSVIGPLWSVSVEEQFYLTWPLLVAVLPRRFLRPVCLGMIGLAVGSRWVILASGSGIERVWLNTLAHLDFIAVGALIAVAGVGGRLRLGLPARVALGLGGPLVVVTGTGILWHELLRPNPTGGWPLLKVPGSSLMASAVFLVAALAFGGVILAVLASRGSWLGHPALVYLGRISYGLYVFHMVALRMVESLWGPWRFLAAFAITLLMAAVSFRFLEQPFLRLKERFTYVHSTPPPAMAETAEEIRRNFPNASRQKPVVRSGEPK